MIVKRMGSCINNSLIVSFSQNVPPDVSVCGFVLAHCLSVRALQEMLTQTEHLAAEVRMCFPHTSQSCIQPTALRSFSLYDWCTGVLHHFYEGVSTSKAKWRQMHSASLIYILPYACRNASSLTRFCFLLTQLSAGGSHRTLLYGQAVLFLHSYSSMVSRSDTTPRHLSRFLRLFYWLSVDLQYLSCLASSRSASDKLAFDVGLREDKGGIKVEE